MALSDVTAEGVERAMVEFDRLGRDSFLARYGFGQARGYYLIRGGRSYDSKAVVGAAHGYDRPELGPLRPQDFPGGEATVARRLESLGFAVQRPPRNPPWAEEELVLALDLYLRSGQLDDAHSAVLELSRVLNDLTIQPERPDAARFRNPNGVALKLANFAAIDPNYTGRGMTRGGKRDNEVWKRYASDEDMLTEVAAAIREGRKPQSSTVRLDESAHPHVVEVEAQHVEHFQVSVPSQEIESTRREQTLVLKYVHYLRNLGHRVTRHRYPRQGVLPSLVCDLVDETDCVLYEAKGDVRRTSVRMAIGQIIDYRRFEPPAMSLAILLPREPSQDLVELIRSVPATAVWKTADGFASVQPPAIGTQKPVKFRSRAEGGGCRSHGQKSGEAGVHHSLDVPGPPLRFL